MRIRRVCVYCGSSAGSLPQYMDEASRLGAYLAQQGRGLVYGGAGIGLMGAVADAALELGGEVIGVIPEKLAAKVRHAGLSDLIVVKTMHERKAKMFELADAFIALPGGFGTVEELFELLTWSQLGYSEKPCGILNIAGYFDPLLEFIDHAVEHKFIKPVHRDSLIVCTDAQHILHELEEYTPRHEEKWIKG